MSIDVKWGWYCTLQSCKHLASNVQSIIACYIAVHSSVKRKYVCNLWLISSLFISYLHGLLILSYSFPRGLHHCSYFVQKYEFVGG
jgi:hypothetical protein